MPETKKPSPQAVAAKLHGLEAYVYSRVKESPFAYCPYCGLEQNLTQSELDERVCQCECGAPIYLLRTQDLRLETK